jgi:hypothetical protein
MIIDAKPKMPGVECWSRVGLFGSAPLGEGSTYAFASISDPRLQVAHATGDLDAFTAVWAEALPAAAPLLGHLAHLRGGVTRRVRDRAIAVVSRPALIDRQVRSTQQIDPSEVHARSRACTA